MLAIAWSLLGGWVLSLFGFQSVVIAGMLQIFGVTINALGYYFLFAMFGAFSRLASLNSGKSTIETKKNAGQEVGKSFANLKNK